MRYFYDEVNRLRNIAYPDVHYATAFTYFKDGARNTMTDTRGLCCSLNGMESDTTTYGYDAARRLTSVQTTFKSNVRLVQYGYNEANDRTTITYPDNKLVTYGYDELNRMSTVTPNWLAGGFTQYAYDAAGRLQTSTLPAGTALQVAYGFDPANRLTSVTNKKSGVAISSSTYVPNPNGTRQSVTDINSMTTQYGYDSLDRLNAVTYPGQPQVTYGYDAVGNRLSVSSPATTYTYDEADQLKKINGGSTTSDANGDLMLIDANNTFLYDQENRLLRTGPCRADLNEDGVVNGLDLNLLGARFLSAEGSTPYDLQYDVNGDGMINGLDLNILGKEFLKSCTSTGSNTGNERNYYNGDGLRMRARTFPGGVATDHDFVWDVGAGLPQILQDTNVQGAAATTFVYGLGLISTTDGNNVTSYYLGDGLGSTTLLTDSGGTVTDTYTYDVFGGPQTVTGTTANDFRFTGQQDDRNANRGLYYLRARHYDPTLGRFLERDRLPLNQRYTYASNNPGNVTDPAGMWCSSVTDCAGDVVSGVATGGDWAWDHGGSCVVSSSGNPGDLGYCGAAALLTSPIGDSVAGMFCNSHTDGYTDYNLTGQIPGVAIVATGGVQVDCKEGHGTFHPYRGAGFGGGYTASVFTAPHQHVTTGLFCGLTVAGPFIGGQLGASSGGVFLEGGANAQKVWGASGSVVCANVQ